MERRKSRTCGTNFLHVIAGLVPAIPFRRARARLSGITGSRHAYARRPGDDSVASALHQRALALVERPEGVLSGNRGDDLQVVPRTLRLGRLLHLDQVHVMDGAAIRTD